MGLFLNEYFIKAEATDKGLYDRYITMLVSRRNVHQAREALIEYLKEEKIEGEYRILDIKKL